MFGFLNKKPAKIYRRMGFGSDQNGILRRFKREEKYWEPHLHNTQKAVLDFAATVKGNKIAILGSGWLLDVPVNELCNMYNEVCLFDIRHPKRIVKMFSGKNIRFIETDLSGYALEIYALCKRQKRITKEVIELLVPEISYNFEEFDCVISCNVLDQLDDLLVGYINNNAIFAEGAIQKIREAIQKFHLQILPPNKSLLITDVTEINTDNNNEVIKEIPLLYIPIDRLSKTNEWVWEFDNSQTYRGGCNTYFEVAVFKV